jgi:hypothetical protein
MSYKSNPVHEAADKVAELTGIPKLNRLAQANQRAYRTRRQILLPMLALAGSIAAFVAALYGIRFMGAIAPIFFVLAMLAQQFGPVRRRSSAMPYDECEQLLIWRSRSIGMGVAVGLAVIGLAGFNALALFEALGDMEATVPLHRLVFIGTAAMWLLTTTATALTTISASLMLPKDIEDETALEE